MSEAQLKPLEDDVNGWTRCFFRLALGAFAFLAVCVVVIYAQACYIIGNQSGIVAGLISLRILQVTLGLIVGMVTLCLGVLVSWAGIVAPLTIEAGAKDLQGKLVTSSPGIILVLCGTGLMALALLQKVDVQEGNLHAFGYGPPTYTAPNQEGDKPPR